MGKRTTTKQLKAAVTKSGKIGASLGAAEKYIAQKEREQAERDAAYRAGRVEETTNREKQAQGVVERT